MYYIVYTPKASEEVHEHSYTPTIDEKHTCTEDGQITYSCSCGDSYVEIIEAQGHSWTVEENGRKICSSCGEIDDSEVGDNLPNNSGSDNGEENTDNEDIPKKENFLVRFFKAIANFFRTFFAKLFGKA